jgi:hypothetical protein
MGNTKRKGLMLLSIFLLTLAVTSGLFAYTYNTTTITLGTTPVAADYGTVTDNNNVPAYTFLGKTKGTIQAGGLFDVTRGSGYSGDLEVIVSLSNVDLLVEDYSFWMLRVEFVDGALNPVDMEESTQVLSLSNPEVSFIVDSTNLSVTRTVYTPGGSYRVYPAVKGLPDNDPILFCQVVQASQHQ